MTVTASIAVAPLPAHPTLHTPPVTVLYYHTSSFAQCQEIVVAGEVITEIHCTLLKPGVTLIIHLPGNARAKGKIESLFTFIQGRSISEHRANRLDELDCRLWDWIHWYDNSHMNRHTRCIPRWRCTRSAFTALDGANRDDVFCLKEERKVGTDNSFSLDGVTCTIAR